MPTSALDNGFRDRAVHASGFGLFGRQFGKKITLSPRQARPRAFTYIVSDIDAARGELVARGVEMSESVSCWERQGAQFQPARQKQAA